MKIVSDKPKVLVTGGAGFIGSHTCKALASAGFLPVTYDNLSTGNRKAVKWGPFIEGDIRDDAHLARALIETSPVGVLHFAASAYVGESVSDPGKYYDNNVGGMIALISACRSADVSNLVFSSSCATYGVPDQLPITERSPQVPINPYGRTKLICEQMLADHAASGGLSYIALRYFNAAGADAAGELGEWHNPETHLIPRALMAAAGLIGFLDVFGNDYPTKDGTCVRDYIHVTDLADAHVSALHRLLRQTSNFCINLGCGHGHSILDVLASIQRLTGRAVPVKFHARRQGDPANLVADATLAKVELGFTACHSDLDNIIRTAAQSFGLETWP